MLSYLKLLQITVNVRNCFQIRSPEDASNIVSFKKFWSYWWRFLFGNTAHASLHSHTLRSPPSLSGMVMHWLIIMCVDIRDFLCAAASAFKLYVGLACRPKRHQRLMALNPAAVRILAKP